MVNRKKTIHELFTNKRISIVHSSIRGFIRGRSPHLPKLLHRHGLDFLRDQREAESVTVRHLIESIRRGDGSDAERLEEEGVGVFHDGMGRFG